MFFTLVVRAQWNPFPNNVGVPDPAQSGIIFPNIVAFLCSYQLRLLDGYYFVCQSIPTGWVFVSLVYECFSSGIYVYHDGLYVSVSTSKQPAANVAGIGNIVMGRKYVDADGKYASAEVDELMLFNAALSEDEIPLHFNR